MKEDCREKLNLYCSVFEERAHIDMYEPFFGEFFREQVLSYLNQKNTSLVTAPEVDMISDLILDAWEDFQDCLNQSFMVCRNIHGLMKSVHIDFPLVEKDQVL